MALDFCYDRMHNFCTTIGIDFHSKTIGVLCEQAASFLGLLLLLLVVNKTARRTSTSKYSSTATVMESKTGMTAPVGANNRAKSRKSPFLGAWRMTAKAIQNAAPSTTSRVITFTKDGVIVDFLTADTTQYLTNRSQTNR